MDSGLWNLPAEQYRSGSKLPKVIARSILEALVVIQELGGTHTDVESSKSLRVNGQLTPIRRQPQQFIRIWP